MLWVRGEPLHEGHLFDLTLRDLLDLDLFLARYAGEIRHWWQIVDLAEDVAEMRPDTRPHHPEIALLLAVRVWGSYRASGRTESLMDILDSGLAWDEVLVTGTDEQGEPAEKLPRGFRTGNTQTPAMPEVEDMDLVQEVNRRYLLASRMFGYTPQQLFALSLYAWLGVAAAVDAREEKARG